jgi:hypothetical protein
VQVSGKLSQNFKNGKRVLAVVSVKCDSMKCPEEIQQNFSARNFNLKQLEL